MKSVRRPSESALVLVDDRQRSDDPLGSRGDVRGSQGTISKELGCVEGVGEPGGKRRLEQRGAVAFAVVISSRRAMGHLMSLNFWQRRTNFWRPLTSPGQASKRPRNGSAKRSGIGRTLHSRSI